MSSNSSSSSTREGNTKSSPVQISPAKGWCFTVHKKTKCGKVLTEEMISSISSRILELCEKALMSHELGENGETPHIQGFLKFKTKKRPKQTFSDICDWIRYEKQKGSDGDQLKYISKENPPFFSLGYPKPVKIIEPTYKWEQNVLEIIKTEPDDRKIYWIWSKEGCVGKTSFCKYLTIKHGAIALSGKASDMRNGVIDYVKNNGSTPELVLIPIPRSYNTDFLNYEGIENIKDMYFYSGKYEGGQVCGNPPHLFVFANEPPDTSKMSEDRWAIYQIYTE